MTSKIFEHLRRGGGLLTEWVEDGRFFLTYTEGERTYTLPMYDINEQETEPPAPYLGHTQEEVIDSGRDLLGTILLANGEPRYSDVLGVLPRLTEGSYCFIGSAAGHAGMTVDRMGAVYPQPSARDRAPAPAYQPHQSIPELEGVMPRQVMLAERIPMLLNIYPLGERIVEILYFVEAGDSDRDPTIWIREKCYPKNAPADAVFTYKIAPIALELPYEEMVKRGIDDRTVIDAFADTVAYWIGFGEEGCSLSLPEARLANAAHGCMAAAAITCTGDRPHYGHGFYGRELHDNFPPNYIFLIEAAVVTGRAGWARRVFAYMLRYALTDEGRFVYRQGADLVPGASAAEYGCLLFLAERYRDLLGIAEYEDILIKRLRGMGDVLLSHAVACPELGGRVFIKMCAEADTNSRIHVYLNNNLWAIRGLRALDALLSRQKESDGRYAAMAECLWQNVSLLLKERAVTDDRFGRIPPFRLDMTEPPHTLSYCRETFAPMTEEALAAYLQRRPIERQDGEAGVQDATENCFANYRYYPEMLSAMLLPRELADGAEALREGIGGECLGMGRFLSWVDDWPILHHARFLLETGRIDKYLLLLYAHTELHGNREKLIYYEQVRLFGMVSANDCLPSLLTTPCMVSWMLAYEPTDGGLALLPALPKAWYGEAFSALGIGYSGGKVDILGDGEGITLRFSPPSPEGTYLVLRERESLTTDDITEGRERVAGVDGNKILLLPGTKEVRLVLKGGRRE